MEPPGEGLFREIVLAPDREIVPEARPVVSFADTDDDRFLTEVRKRTSARYELARRGESLGSWAELRPAGLLPKRPRRRRREVIQRERWGAARPIYFPQALSAGTGAAQGLGVAGLLQSLRAPGGLARHLDARSSALAPEFEPLAGACELFDPERDLERVLVRPSGAAPSPGPDLWVKTGRLSTHPEDHSLRMRVSFGREGDDDASWDEEGHARVAQLAQRLIPGARSLEGTESPLARIAEIAGQPLYLTQHIAYWNAPGGGARFHHDAFAQETGARDEDVDGSGQRGVMYTQFTGRTAWIALSIEELVVRVQEFIGWVDAGEMPWIRSSLGDGWSELRTACSGRGTCLRELSRPGCGLFRAFIDGPEFTCYMADSGHALILEPGDTLVLPNHGVERTAMHSVFCASDEPAFGVSAALRVRC